MRKKFFTWLITSSADPAKSSATIQGFAMTWVSLLITVAQAFHYNVSYTSIAETIQTACAFFGSLLTVFGLARKLYFSLKAVDITKELANTEDIDFTPQ